ncbi:MAG: polyphosphate kinase 1, partial [Bacteroidota bacterium]
MDVQKETENNQQNDKLVAEQIAASNYISRDLSWMQFNLRVLDQARHMDRSIIDRLKFLAITASNLDEFCTIRLGSLCNYIDYGKERFDYSGLREVPFRNVLLEEIHRFTTEQNSYFSTRLRPMFEKSGFRICSYDALSVGDAGLLNQYFERTSFPRL